MKKKEIITGLVLGLAFIGGTICWKNIAFEEANKQTKAQSLYAIEPLAVSAPADTSIASLPLTETEKNPKIGTDGSISLQAGTIYEISPDLLDATFSFEVSYPALCKLSISSETDITVDFYFESTDKKALLDRTGISQNETSVITRFLQEGMYFLQLNGSEPDTADKITIMYEIDSDEDVIGNNYKQAYILTVPDKVVSGIEYLADEDWYTFDIEYEREVIVHLTGDSNFIAVLYALDENNELVYVSDNHSLDHIMDDESFEQPENSQENTKKDLQEPIPEETAPAVEESVPEESQPEKTAPTKDSKPDQKKESETSAVPSSVPRIPSLREQGMQIQQMSQSENKSSIQRQIPETTVIHVGNESNKTLQGETTEEQKNTPEEKQQIKKMLTPGKYYLRIYNIDPVADVYNLVISAGIFADFGDTWEKAANLQADEVLIEKFGTYIDEDWYSFHVEENEPVQITISNCAANIFVYKNIYNAEPVYYDNQSLEISGDLQILSFTDPGQYFLRLYGGDPSQPPYEIILRNENSPVRG